VYKLVCFTGTLFFSRNPSFEIKKIVAHSDGRLTPALLTAYAKVKPGMNLFAFDFDTVRSNLQSVSLIESAQVRRKLPDTLMIDVVERVAVAQVHWKWQAMPYLIDRYGVVLPPTKTGLALPLIEGYKTERLQLGDQITHAGVRYVLELLSACDLVIEPGFQVNFERFDLRYSDYINATLEDDVSVRFPNHSSTNKLIRLADTLQAARERGERIKTVDLTPDGRNVPVTYH